MELCGLPPQVSTDDGLTARGSLSAQTVDIAQSYRTRDCRLSRRMRLRLRHGGR